jgi:hypothetical protein
MDPRREFHLVQNGVRRAHNPVVGNTEAVVDGDVAAFSRFKLDLMLFVALLLALCHLGGAMQAAVSAGLLC